MKNTSVFGLIDNEACPGISFKINEQICQIGSDNYYR